MKQLTIILSIAILLFSIGCNQGSSSSVSSTTKLEGAPAPFDGSKKVHFALIRQIVEGEFMQMWQEGAQKQADLMGIQLTVFGKNMDDQAQADFVYQAINMQVDGIILDHGLTEILSKPAADAIAAGIPVVAFDVDVQNPEINQIAQDDHALGRIVLDAMNKDYNQQANIGYVYFAGILPLDKRDQAFTEFKKEFPNMKEITRTGTIESPLYIKNAELVKATLKSNPNVNAYFAPYDEFAKGVIIALDEEGLNNKIKVYGADISTQDIELMTKEGSPWVATAATSPKLIGALSVRALALKVAGEKIPDDILITPTLFTQDMLRESDVKNMVELQAKFPEFNKTTNMTASWIPLAE